MARNASVKTKLQPVAKESAKEKEQEELSPAEWLDLTVAKGMEARAYDIFVRAFHKGLLVRTAGDVIALSPPLIVEKAHIAEIAQILTEAIKEAA